MDPEQYDEINNLVVACLFESYLAKFILEHPEFYQDLYIKILDVVERFLTLELPRKPALNRCLDSKKVGYDLSRHIYTIFSLLNECYPGQSSFYTLKSEFNLSSADYFIKLFIDHFLTAPAGSDLMTHNGSPISLSKRSFFSMSPIDSRRSPFKPARSPLLFSEENRGVFEIVTDSDEYDKISTRSIGIVSEHFTPDGLTDYFETPVRSARFNYKPNEESYVAQWLRLRHLPVISGASGSTEGLINLFFPLCDLTEAEKKILIFVQSCNMVANGHHSFFEAMMVADHLGYDLEEQPSLLDFYLQCIPESIRMHETFIEFMASSQIQLLLEGFPLLDPFIIDMLTP